MLRAILLLTLLCSLTPALFLQRHDDAASSVGQLRRVTDTPASTLNLNPSLSGDGKRLAFESTADLAGAGARNNSFHALLSHITDAGASFKEMSATRALSASVSQDGSSVAFASSGNPLGKNNDGNSEIFFYDGASLRQLTDTLPDNSAQRTTDGNFAPSITDDGRFIAFSSNRDLTHTRASGLQQIFLYDTSAQTFKSITEASANNSAANPKISGDGSRIAYLMSDEDAPDSARRLLLYDRASETTRVIADNLHALSLPYGRTISDDGARIVYSANAAPDNASQLFLYDAASARTRQMTHLPARDADVPLQPTISGDGKRLAFATRRNALGGKSDGSVELYLLDIPTNELRQVTNAPAAANAEVISSLNDDGSIVAFNFPRVLSGPVSANESANNSEIYLAQLAARPSFADILRVSNAASLDNEPAALKADGPNALKSIAQGSIAIAYGDALAFEAEEAMRDALGNFPYSLGGTTVTVNNQPARLFYVSPHQVNFQIPPEIITGPAELVVTNSEGFQTRGTCEITRTAPGIFTVEANGRGAALALDALTLQVGPFDPTGGGHSLIIFATAARNASRIQAVINGYTIEAESVQASTDLAGLDEIHLPLPVNLGGAGAVTLTIRADGLESNPVMLTLAGESVRDIVINELLADPPDGIAGDANRDGMRSAPQDEFIELVNTTARDIDVGGYQITTRPSAFADNVLRHTFARGTIMPAGTALVIFGGANRATFNPLDRAFGGAQVFTASTGGLSLINSGGIVTLLEPTGAILDQLSYGGASGLKADADQSLTRSPDLTGRFAQHKLAEGGAGRAFSPGTRVDGTAFADSNPLARIEVSPTSVNILTGAQQGFVAHAFDRFGNELSGVIFRWQTSAPSVATIAQDGVATGIAEGTAEIRALARGVESAPVLLQVRPRERILTRIEVAPSSIALYAGGAQQFTARAYDQDDKELKDVTFNWSSNFPSVAVVDETGLASAVAPGSALITATARNVSASAALYVIAPPLVINEVLADPPDGAAGDANHDSVRNGTEDEFIEIVNSSNDALDLSGWTIRTKSFNGTANEITRHTFAKGTTLAAQDALVVFGGGSPDAQAPVFGGAQIVKASGNNLSLSNSGLEIIIRDASGNFVTRFLYGTAGDDFGGDSINQSITRSPDINGPYTRHSIGSGPAKTLYSPGTKTDGSFFVARIGQLTKILLTSDASAIFVDGSTEATVQALDQFNRPLPGAAFSFNSLNEHVAVVGPVNTDAGASRARATIYGRGPGKTQITARAMLDQKIIASEPLSLTVEPAPPKISRVELTPLSSVINRGGTQQFKATALDQNNVALEGATFVWTSSDANVASINSSGLARGVGIGTATLTASIGDGAGGSVSGTATLRVEMPLVINEVLADVPPDNAATSGVVEGDANRDGVRNADDDEFIELLNNSEEALDLSGLRIFDAGQNSPRFTFPANTMLAAGRAVVIFGGGSPPANEQAFGGAMVMTVADSATSSSTLSLNDGGDTISLKLPVGASDVDIASLTYGAGGAIPAPSDQSLTRAPDADINPTGGDFVAHTAATNAAGRVFSPGTRNDGTPFGSPPITRIEIAPVRADIKVGQTQLFNARAFSDVGGTERELPFVSFIWDVDATGKAELSPVTGVSTIARGLAAGGPEIRARAGGGQAVAALNIKAIVAAVELTPETASLVEGDSQLFKATARDASGQLIPDLSFAFTLRDQTPTNAASITQTSADSVTVRGEHAGTATVAVTYAQPDGPTFEDISTLRITPALPRVARIEVSPSSLSLNRGATQQFTARAFDEHDEVLPNVKFDWTTNEAAILSVDGNGFARAAGVGAATLKASASDNRGGMISGAAMVNVLVPLVINEILADPPGSVAADLQGDANRDGVRDSDDDEFVELVNHSQSPVDISGVRLADATSARYTVPAGTVLAPEQALVIFGGGQPPGDDPAFGGALIQKTSTLSLNNGGDTLTLVLTVNGADVSIAAQTYGADAGLDQSLTRSPDVTGDFLKHTLAQGSDGRLFSPGTRNDGAPFGSLPITRIEVTPSSQTVDIGAQQTFIARAYANRNGAEEEIHSVSFIWDSTDKGKASVSPSTGASTTARALSDGSVTIRAGAGGVSGAATLSINPPPPVLTSITLAPASATLTEGETIQLMAQALDQYGQAMKGISISFTSSETRVVTIDDVTRDADKGFAVALLMARAQGTAEVVAQATDGARSVLSQPSNIKVNPAPPIIKRIEVSPASATIGAGAMQQFTAQAFDQYNQPIAGVTFNWASSDESVANINQDGLATALRAGTTLIKASAGSISSDPAALTVMPPPVPTAGQLIINEALVSFATSTTQARHDFLELYNRVNQTLDISGLVISFRLSGSSNTPATLTLPGAVGSGTTLIAPNGYFLIVNGADTFGATADLNAGGFDLNNTTGGIKLEINDQKLDGLTYQGGSTAAASPFNSYGEGSPLLFTSGSTNDLLRSPNANDTGSNASDFRRNGSAASVSPKAANPTIP